MSATCEPKCHGYGIGCPCSRANGTSPRWSDLFGIAPEFTDDLADERADILARFTAELAKATGDGSKKRRAGTKPPWYADDSHEAAMYRHLERWEAGEKHDPDHEAHPLVAAAWRAIAIACKESGNVPNG